MSKGVAAVNFFSAGGNLFAFLDALISGNPLSATISVVFSIACLFIGTLLLKDAK